MTTPVRIGINGFGRMGRLALRAAWAWPELEFVHVNEAHGDAATCAHLLEFDSVHGRWPHAVAAEGTAISIDGTLISTSQEADPAAIPWGDMGIDLVLESTGRFKTLETLQPHFDNGARKVVVAAPVKDPAALNVVMGVNDHLYDPAQHRIVTAASCTTNCLAPVVDVIHRSFGIRHGSITTVHDITNTQSVLDGYHKDLRRARACGQSLIPTSTGSATAITEIFPELKGRLNGIAIRVPITNASLTDCVFELEQHVTVEQINDALRTAAEGRLQGILGYEERPLVSADYVNDPRSSIVDALSTMVINGTQVKILAWYDNEIGYVHRMMELAMKVGRR